MSAQTPSNAAPATSDAAERAYNYVATAYRGAAVNACARGHFEAADTPNLLVARGTHLEVHRLTEDGLVPRLDVPIYGRIASLKLFRPKKAERDSLFLCTERGAFCVLKYNESDEIETLANGSFYSRTSRPNESGQLCSIDPALGAIAVHMYEGLVTIVPLNAETGELGAAFDVRVDELGIIDMQFIHGNSNSGAPQLVLLFEDAVGSRHLTSYSVELKEKSLTRADLKLADTPAGSSCLVAVPPPIGGVLLAGEQVVVHVDRNARRVTRAPMQPGAASCITCIDDDGSRWLLADAAGGLRVICLRSDDSGVKKIDVAMLGRTSCGNCMAYLDSGVLFLGSRIGDSQLLSLGGSDNDMDDDNDDGDDTEIDVIETFTNIGPIVDMCVMDLDREGQGQVVTCSGAYSDGSLRVVRNGVGIEEQAAVDLEGVRQLWSLRASSALDAPDRFVVMSFTAGTRVLSFADDELEETTIAGFGQDQPTLFAGNVPNEQLLHVTAEAARLVACGDLDNHVAIWKPENGKSISTAAANAAGQLIIALGGGELVYLQVENASFQQVSTTQLDHEVACIDVSPITGDFPKGTVDLRKSFMCAVGLWNDASLRLLSLPDLNQQATLDLGAGALPRSVVLSELAPGNSFAIVGLGDGSLVSCSLTKQGQLKADSRKKVLLGTQAVSLTQFCARGKRHVFAALDRPAVLYVADDGGAKLRYSNVDVRDVGSMCPLNNENFSDSLCLASAETLTIGCVDEMQRLHVRTYPLEEMPRRIAHMRSAGMLAVLTVQVADVLAGASANVAVNNNPSAMQHDDNNNNKNDNSSSSSATVAPSVLQERSFVRLIDDQTFEVIDSFELQSNETGLSLLYTSLQVPGSANAVDYFVVGTACVQPGDVDPSGGRLLVFDVVDKKLRLASQSETSGAVYSLDKLGNDGVAGGVGACVCVWRWRHAEASEVAAASAASAATNNSNNNNNNNNNDNNNTNNNSEGDNDSEAAIEQQKKKQKTSDASEGGRAACGRVLRQMASRSGHVLALHVRTQDSLVVVGDLMQSVAVWRVEPDQHGRDALTLVARDAEPNWMTALEVLTDDVYLGGENNYNLVSLRHNASAALDDERYRLEALGEYHVADYVNVMRHGSLVMAAPDETASAIRITQRVAKTEQDSDKADDAGDNNNTTATTTTTKSVAMDEETIVTELHLPARFPTVLYGTVSGALGVVASLPAPMYSLLHRVQMALTETVRGVGGLDHADWRTFRNARKSNEAHGFIDGDLVETFLDLDAGKQATVATAAGASAEHVTQIIEHIVSHTH